MGRIRDLFTDRIWSIDTGKVSMVSKSYARLVTFIKLVRITINTFTENKMGFQCVALSYFVTLAIIPLLALIFAITGGLGLSELLDKVLLSAAAYVDPMMLSLVEEKAENIIDIAQNGWVGVVAALSFLWTILWMMFQVERVFNNVWGIQKIPRKLYKRVGYYFMILILMPVIIVIFGLGIAYYGNITKFIGLDLSDLRILPTLLGYLGLYIITTFTFSAMYKFIPATEVKYKNALKAAAVGAFVFVVFQYLYLETQVFVARMNTVYGVLAAIPLFLIWLNFSWQIIIYGAELTYSFQNIKNYGLQEVDNR